MKIKIAQIGMGHDHAMQCLTSLLSLSDLFEVVGVCLPDEIEEEYESKLENFPNVPRLTLPEILENPEILAVTVETTEKNLAKYSIMCAKANKHIHMDKPGGEDLGEFEELVNLTKQKKVQFHLGYMYRYNPEVLALKEQIKNGELGEVFCVEAQMGCIFPTTAQKRQWLEQFKGGMTFFLGCHLVDIIVSIMGKPEKITPYLHSTGIDGVTAKDYGFAVFEYKTGVSFLKSCAAEVAGGARRQIVVCGTKKTVEIKPIEVYDGESKSKMCTDVAYYQNAVWEADEKRRSKGFDRYDGMMTHFYECVTGKIENEFDYDYELLVYKCLLKACGYEGEII